MPRHTSTAQRQIWYDGVFGKNQPPPPPPSCTDPRRKTRLLQRQVRKELELPISRLTIDEWQYGPASIEWKGGGRGLRQNTLPWESEEGGKDSIKIARSRSEQNTMQASESTGPVFQTPQNGDTAIQLALVYKCTALHNPDYETDSSTLRQTPLLHESG